MPTATKAKHIHNNARVARTPVYRCETCRFRGTIKDRGWVFHEPTDLRQPHKRKVECLPCFNERGSR
jgi:hypothetical protein